MTIDFTIPWETKSFLEPSQAAFYPAKIPHQHEQLKNFISTVNPHVIYYASAFDIYALEVSLRRRTLVKSLPWQPLCLDAAHGWICVGGEENGQCAFISIYRDTVNGAAVQQSYSEVDDLLPLDLDPEYRHVPHDYGQPPPWPGYPLTPKYHLQHHELGSQRVNSIKIHLLRSTHKNLQDDIVAVITNNDGTVQIYSLSQSRILETLNFPTRMNHASISPDGTLLLAVGDEGPGDEIRAFFCRRVDASRASVEGDLTYPRYKWHRIAEPRLGRAGADEDACFCTAFSPSGHMCAVASQSGIITVFDTALIRDEMETGEAVIAVLHSTRPSRRLVYSGAIRSMCFSPTPWDLLAWAEDQGRLCLVDLRTVFQSRQVVELETDSLDLYRVPIEDHEGTSDQGQLEFERRFVERHRELVEAQDNLAAVNHTADYVELAAEQRRIERETPALSSSERQMIDPIGLRRIQENLPNASDSSSTAPVSVNYTPNRHIEAPNWNGLPSSTPSSNAQNRATASIHDFMRQRNWERSRTSDRSYTPRRRSSIVISNNSNTQNSSSQHSSSSLAPIGTATPTLSTSPSRLPTINPDTTIPHLFDASDPWQTITDAIGSTTMPNSIARLRSLQSRNLERRMQATVAPQATLDRRMQALQEARDRSRAEVRAEVEAIANRARQGNPPNAREIRALRADMLYEQIERFGPTRHTRHGYGVVTMGIGWNVDGRKLFVATEEGILEYPINVAERKTSPGVAFL